MSAWNQHGKWLSIFFVVVAVMLFFCDGRALKGEPVKKEWTETVTGMEFVWIPGGCFMMGCVSESSECESDERPVHKVCVDGFWMGKYEVTNQQYRIWKPEHVSRGYDVNTLDGNQQPVVRGIQRDFYRFTEWLTDQHQRDYTFRLPTEAEWEYAARAGTTTSSFWGNTSNDACRYANIYDLTAYRERPVTDYIRPYDCDDGYATTAPVGRFLPNAFGLYDMLGNVSEFCLDWWDKKYYAASPVYNPQGPLSGNFLVERGGSWGNDMNWSRARIAARHMFMLSEWDMYSGFRVVRVDGNWQRQHGIKDPFTPTRPHLPLQRTEHACCTPQVRPAHILQRDGARISSVAFSPDGRLLASGSRSPIFETGSRDNSITLWDVNTGKRLNTLEGHGNDVYSVAFSPDGSILASGSRDKTVILWDVESGTQQNRFHGVQDDLDYMYFVAFSPDGATLFAGSASGRVYAWNLETGKQIRTFTNDKGRTETIAVTPDGTLLITGNSWKNPDPAKIDDKDFYQFWEVQSGKMLFEVSHIKYWGLNGLALSSDGRIVAFAGEDEIEIWETETQRLLHCLEKPNPEPVRVLAFSPNGHILASGSNDYNVYLWDATTFGKVRSVAKHRNNISALAFSPDSKLLASADVEGGLALWHILPKNGDPIWK